MSRTLRTALRCFGGCIGVLAAHAAAQAQDQTAPMERVEEVIVTGTRAPKSVDKIPGAINVVSEAEVSRTLSLTQDATAVLARTVPGYSESSQAMNSIGETLRGRVPLRLFDGIPQSTPLRDGSRNGVFTDMDTVGRIEVINGPSAAEGIGAAGGIINYISKDATEPGLNFNVFTNLSSQFEDDSDSWKAGGTLTYKSDDYDLVLNGSLGDRGITYDANGRRIGLSASSSSADSETENLFVKAGMNFGADGNQRLQFSASHFKLDSKGDYHWVEGSRALGIPDTSEPGPPLGTGGVPLAGTEFNEFEQYVLTYKNFDLFGGSFTADAYNADQAMRFPADNSADRQDPLIAPIGELVDQSEVKSEKEGVRTSWTRPDLFAEGLELHVGLDVREGQDRAAARAHQSRLGAADGVHEHRAVPAAVVRHRPGHVQRRRAPRGRRARGERLHHDVLPQSRVRPGRQARLQGRPAQRRRDLAHHGRLVGVRFVQRGLHAAEHRHPPAQHQRAGAIGRGHPRPAGDHLRQQGSGLQLARRPRQLRRLVLQVDLRSRRFAERRSGHAGLRAQSRAGGDRRLRVHRRLSHHAGLEGHRACTRTRAARRPLPASRTVR